MTSIPKVYEPHEVESRWYKFWVEQKYFHAAEVSDKPPFSIVIPPPNVTGDLHIGHALDNTLQDILIRWKRMQGYNTLWMPGTDHAGIVTQVVVERQLLANGTSRQELGREKFLAKMWEWKEKSRAYIVEQLMRMGCSCDWDRERFTLDEGLSKAVREAFVRLYNDGLIYRSAYMVNWCPKCLTAISDLEVEHEDEQANLYYIKYPLKNSDEYLLIATTRPETMLGDTAVAVHPDDERYTRFIGKTAILPIAERELPIIADEYVDRQFGTGALKITPAHDPNDFEIGRRHNLPEVVAINADGIMSEAAGKYESMERFACRKALLQELKEKGYLLKVEEYIHAVGRHDRCGTIIEPFVSLQWFVKMKPLAEKAIAAAERGDVKFIPAPQKQRFYDWMYSIRDWCISRQIWWGHQLPIWYCKDCHEMIAAIETPAKCLKCASTNLQQDTDVLDTWFSSGLWPFSTMGWPENTELVKTFYPTSVLVTGWDILFFWVARMIMMGLKCMDEIPFRDVYLHGLVADETGRKMSKSVGNAIDPIPMMEKYGTDAFRFAIAASTIPGPYMPLPEDRIKGYRNFANKIWNASRFVLMNIEDFKPSDDKPLKLMLCDHWIISRFNKIAQEVTKCLQEFRFDDAALSLYTFLWHEYCDWYVEMVKLRMNDSNERYTAQYVASAILEGTLRLLHPFMPFITEEIWQQLPTWIVDCRLSIETIINHQSSIINHQSSIESIVIAPWPEYQSEKINDEIEATMGLLMDVIDNVRSILGEMNVPSSRAVEVLIQTPEEKERTILTEHLSDYINAFIRTSKIDIAEHHDKPEAAAVAVVGNVEIYIPLGGIIDIDKEKSRLMRRLEKADKDLAGIEKTLSNEDFIAKAPEEIIRQRRERKVELEAEKVRLEKNLEMLGK
ncbi:valine--tRNA ligase [Candidatus Poribacteria bacterium]|nr:valine--tRNA ligase [Candidatus Poribacteria bacterium]